MNAKLKSAIEQSIAAATGAVYEIQRIENCGGGCINDAVIICGDGCNYFVKLNKAAALEMFIAEASGLREIRAAGTIRAPEPLVCGSVDNTAYLVLEALEFGGRGDWQEMGRQLAKLHLHTEERFGWKRDNTIGSTPQHNGWMDNWAEFFRDQRLRFQFQLARKNGYQFELSDALLDSVTTLLKGHTPEPSLLHGDLWSGNASFLSDGQPVVYDPACYYGDRETDLAFSEYFGGFPSDFYNGYKSEWPLDDGYERRKVLYNLYHVLNHVNLFGGGYAGSARQMIKDLT